MITLLKELFIVHWPRKVVALLAAVIIWFLVSHSITVTRSIPNVPVRVLNIPKDRTLEGLLPNGLLSERLTLNVTGRRSTVDNLTGADIEVVTDAAGRGDHWSFVVSKRSLKGTTPEVDLIHGISSVQPQELTIQLSPLVTEKIPIIIAEPIGEPPKGWLFLDVWPQRLYQTVAGPQQQVEALKKRGIRLTLDLGSITEAELAELEGTTKGQEENEVRYFVPDSMKRINLPFGRHQQVEINDPEATYLHIDFLKQELLPLDTEVPVSVYYPLLHSLTLNPDTYKLATDHLIEMKNGIPVLTEPLYARNVSRHFLDTVRDSLQLTLVTVPTDVSRVLPWSIGFVDPARLEEEYVESLMGGTHGEPEEDGLQPRVRAAQLRERFRKYLRDFKLLKADQSPLKLYATLGTEKITVKDLPPKDL